MKKFIFILVLSISTTVCAQNSEYPIKSFTDKGAKAPNTHHLGDAWLNFLLSEEDGLDYNITQATFSPNATLDWHKHSTPQVLIVIEGIGYYQERGKDPIIIREGDVIKCEKDIEHWHTSSIENKVSYIAIYGNSPTIWTEKLSREYYNSVAKKIKSKIKL
ncbi:cupin domain-containing protein [Flagellimonas nanhaiensis]|uniref:Cupin domain-containing protein n=1 Tax=Flagellimonas nanhaiensis TaxID=2292706 RepID=A0A371JS80_9FLAO|nr:cupin domain-containing protein [Allomuricauda nanhaiensis]RDY60667.1 cupin domain-containing protein [Allomuricauda nanhaiensis]